MLQEVVCPADCETALPAVKFDKCAPDARVSELSHLAIGKGDAAAFANWESAAEWAARLSQSAAGDMIRLLTIRGNKPATQKTTQTLTLNRIVTTKRRHVINFTVDEMTDENYDFFRTSQCGNLFVRAWYISNDTKDLFGGNPGVYAQLFGEPIFDEGTGVLQKFVGTLEWDGKQDPPRAVNPIAGL